MSSVAIVPERVLFGVVKIDLNLNPALNDTVTVYFDPDVATMDGAAPGVPGISFNSYNFGSTNTTLSLNGICVPIPPDFVANYDPIRGGTTYFDVAPASGSMAPEPGSVMLMIGAVACLLLFRYQARPN